MSKRAIRRHHRARMRARSRWILNNIWGMGDANYVGYSEQSRGWVDWAVPRMADNMKLCSVPGCCGQMRKIYGPTIQELRQIDP